MRKRPAPQWFRPEGPLFPVTGGARPVAGGWKVR